MSVVCLGQNGGSASNGEFRPERANTVSPVNQLPDANARSAINAKRFQLQKYAAANMARKRQMGEDSARLLQLAAELNLELGKAGQETLPLAAIEKAGTIEKLAHAVKEKMRLTVAAP